MSALDFTITKGQTYNITIVPQDDAGDAASLTAPPTVTAVDPTEIQVGAVTANADGTYLVPVTGLKNGTSAIKIDATGASALEVEADATVNLPLATKILLRGALAS